MTYDTILFDSDGVLVSGTKREDLVEPMRDVYRSLGAEDVDRQDIDDAMVVNWMSLPRLVGIGQTYDIDIHEFWRRRDELLVEFQRELILDGSKALFEDVSAIFDIDANFGIVSNNQQRTIDFVVEHFELDDRFETYYGMQPTIKAVYRKKPSPHYTEKALEDLDATNALFVGDNESDIVAARCARIDAAYLRRSSDRPEIAVVPEYEIESLDELVHIVDG